MRYPAQTSGVPCHRIAVATPMRSVPYESPSIVLRLNGDVDRTLEGDWVFSGAWFVNGVGWTDLLGVHSGARNIFLSTFKVHRSAFTKF